MKLNDYKDRSVFYDLEFSDTSDTDLIFNNLLNGFKGRILEIPCGSCRFLDIWKDFKNEVVLADLSDSMLDYLKKRICDSKHIIAQRCNLLEISKLGTFDCVLIPREGLQFLPFSKLSFFFKELYKTLTSNGIAYLDLATLSLNCTNKKILPPYIQIQNLKSFDFERKKGDRTLKRWHKSVWLAKKSALETTYFYEYIQGNETQRTGTKILLYEYQYKEIKKLILNCNFVIQEKYGFYDKRPLVSQSPRKILILRKKDEKTGS